jgi:uncharacterized protein YciI
MRFNLRTLATVLVLAHLGAAVTAAQEGESVAAVDAPIPLPQAWDTSYVVLLEANPAYRPGSAEEGQAVLQRHLQYQLRLIADGRTIMGGPLVRQEGAQLVGMTVLRAGSAAEAEAIATADPGVSSGLFRATVRTWTTPARETE